jgi:hypothetical protein
MIKTTITRESVLSEGMRAAQMPSKYAGPNDICPYGHDDPRNAVWWEGYNWQKDAIKKAMEEKP